MDPFQWLLTSNRNSAHEPRGCRRWELYRKRSMSPGPPPPFPVLTNRLGRGPVRRARLYTQPALFYNVTATDRSAGCLRITRTGTPHSRTTRGTATTRSARGRDRVPACPWPGARPVSSSPRFSGHSTLRCCRASVSSSRKISGCTGCGRSLRSGCGSIQWQGAHK